MAALKFSLNIPSKLLVANTPTCIGFVTAPANQRIKLLGYGIYFDGIVGSAQPVEVKLARPTAGTLTPGGTATKTEPGLPETVQSVFGLGASVEPTLTSSLVFKTLAIHPQQGYEYLAPMSQEDQIAGGTNLVVSVNAPQAVNVRGYLWLEE